MAVVDITIGKRTFQLACADGQEPHLQSLAAQVSTRVQDLASQIPGSSETLLLVMASLMMQDEINEKADAPITPQEPANTNNDDEVNQQQEEFLIEALDAVSDYVETIAVRIENS